MMTTEDKELNKSNAEMLADQILTKLQDRGVKAQKEQVLEFLKELKDQQVLENNTPQQRRRMLRRMTRSFYKVGMTAYQVKGNTTGAIANLSLGLDAGALNTLQSGVLSSSTWILLGLIYTA